MRLWRSIQDIGGILYDTVRDILGNQRRKKTQ